jgi:organic hydroperoxide reductase OsmC/OhrA
MQEFPHHYTVAAAAAGPDDVQLTAERLPALHSAAPAEFDGPGDRWSPETLLVGAVGDCFIHTFRAVARASRIEWTSVRCDVTGTVERIDRVTRFTKFEIHAHLMVPAGTEPDRARRALEKAEHNCLISNSLNARVDLIAEVSAADATVAEPIPA